MNLKINAASQARWIIKEMEFHIKGFNAPVGSSFSLKDLNLFLFCFDALRPSQQFFRSCCEDFLSFLG